MHETTSTTVVDRKVEYLCDVGHKDYMNEAWFKFLPFLIFVAVAILILLGMIFGCANGGVILGYIIFAFLWGLLLWWLCSIGLWGWAWFFLLLPLILAVLTGVVAAGVTAGILGAEAANIAAVGYLATNGDMGKLSQRAKELVAEARSAGVTLTV